LSSLDSGQQRTATAEAATQPRSLQQPVGTRAWADELGSRLTMMTEKGQHTASLRLSPEHLGPLEIRIAMREDQASVWFGAAHADTRAAIEHALPRLRELFAAQGMSLADAGVFREPAKQQFTEWQGDNERGTDASTPADAGAVPARVQLGLLDAYA
jgi:flagellar hook-length control protein FliK